MFDAVKSDPEGNYQFIFVVPDLPLGSELIVMPVMATGLPVRFLPWENPSSTATAKCFTNEAGSMISMEFNQLMADPAGSHEQFTVLVNGKINPVTKVALNQTRPVLILPEPAGKAW